MDTTRPTLDFVGVGFSRCGTTWVAKCLADHPDVFVPAEKELYYYNNPDRMARKPLSSFFPARTEGRLLGEYTPRYVIDRTALAHVRHAHPDALLLVSLRDPVERAISQYNYFRHNMNKEDIEDFERALTGPYRVDYVTKSLYADHLETLFGLVDRDEVHIMFTKDFDEDPVSVLETLYSKLGVDSTFRPAALETRLNRSGADVGNVLGTNLHADDGVKLHGKRFEAFDRIRDVGESVTTRLRIRDYVEPVASPLLRKTERTVGRTTSRIESTVADDDSTTRTTIDEAAKQRVYREYFADQVEGLEEMLDVDLSRWKR